MIGSISLGTVFVAGRNRVPRPAAGIIAFLTRFIVPKKDHDVAAMTRVALGVVVILIISKIQDVSFRDGIFIAFRMRVSASNPMS
jgi:hypothetical protein